MKIAIQGHPTRGKEVIQILESLGGRNPGLTGVRVSHYYYINCNGDIDLNLKYNLFNHKFYTLEEFKVEPHKLQLYPMKEERNITLPLDKAKEWYKKGGELKEVALQAYSEEELTKVELPKTWKEFCENYPVQREKCRLSEKDYNMQYAYYQNKITRIWLPSEKSAEAHLAMIKLEQLRDCWRQGWKPEYSECHKYGIKILKGELTIIVVTNIHSFLTFPTREMAEEFLKCFRDLIEKAGDLI